jgi:hypothetical protein
MILNPNAGGEVRVIRDKRRSETALAFSKLKAHLRRAAERTIHSLWTTIGRIVGLYAPQECANYFRACRYDPA